MKRRQMLQLAAALGLPAVFATVPHANAAPLRIRRNAQDPLAKGDLEAFAVALRKMLDNNDANDTHSWMYWANVHGTTLTSPPPPALDGIWDSCDHGAYFLAWHRMYIAYFENVVAQLSGRPDFALPYWDWYASALPPAAFITPAGAENPLWRSSRGYTVRYPVSTAAVESASSDAFAGFNSLCFGDPHSNIHLNFSGEMRSPSTAARDPLFWAHHVAMDRLWEAWALRPGLRQLIPDEPWAGKTFSFTPGAAGTANVRDMLSTASLGYAYDTLVLQKAIVRIPGRPVRSLPARTSQLPESPDKQGTVPLAEARQIQIRSDGGTVVFPLSPAAAQPLESVNSKSLATRLFLVVEGVESAASASDGVFLYDIYINLPKTMSKEATAAPKERHYVGQINSFQASPHHKHGARASIAVPLDALLGGLRMSGGWSPDLIEINFVDPSQGGASSPVSIQSVRIELRN